MNTYIDIFDFIEDSTSGLEWQSLTGNAARFTTAQTAGATSLTVPATGTGSITVALNMFDKIVIYDGSNSEIVQVGSAGATIGATSIPLLAGTSLAFNHGVGIAWSTKGVAGNIGTQILDASAWIERHCYQSLLQSTYTNEKVAMPTMRAAIDNDGQLTFRTRHWPITSITAISIAWTPTMVINYDTTQAFIDGNGRLCSVPNLIVLAGQQQQTNNFFQTPSRSRKGQVQVSYQAGYTYNSLPGDLKEAAVLVTSDLLAKRHNPIGAPDLGDGSSHISAVLRGDLSGESILMKRAMEILTRYSVEMY